MAVSDRAYARFIDKLDLRDIWLHEAHVERHETVHTANIAGSDIETRVRWGQQDDRLLVIHGYRIRLMAERSDTDIVEASGDETPAPQVDDDDQVAVATITVDFTLVYSVEDEVSEELFDQFSEVNLPVNSWPYMREYVLTTLARMNIPGVTIPAFKVKAPHLVDDGTSSSGPEVQ